MFRLIRSIRKYWVPSILTILFMVGEAALETLIPYITADLVNNLSAGGVDMSYLLKVLLHWDPCFAAAWAVLPLPWRPRDLQRICVAI